MTTCREPGAGTVQGAGGLSVFARQKSRLTTGHRGGGARLAGEEDGEDFIREEGCRKQKRLGDLQRSVGRIITGSATPRAAAASLAHRYGAANSNAAQQHQQVPRLRGGGFHRGAAQFPPP